MAVINDNPLLSAALVNAWGTELAKQLAKENVFKTMLEQRPAALAGPFTDEDGRVTFKRVPENFDYWLTRDGCYLKLSEMESSHLIRCIGRIFRSKRGWRADYLPHLQAELDRRDK